MATAAPLSNATAKAAEASATRKNSCFAPDAFKKAKKGKSRDGPDGVFTVGYGCGGIDEMREFLPADDTMVLWALLDFKVGSGKFARMKNIRVHINGESTKNVLKGRINAERQKVEKVIGSINGSLQICHQKECDVESVISKCAKFFATDHGDGEEPMTIKQMKQKYEEQIKMDQAKEASTSTERKTARDFDRKWKNQEILKYIHNDTGPFNWALFRPNKKSMRTAELNNAPLSKVCKFVNAGSLSVNEMLNDVKDDQVLGAILRMGFGGGTFRRAKHIAIWWSGEKVGAVARGALNAKKARIMELLKPWAFTYTAQRKENLTVGHLIDIVHQKLAVDGATDDGSDPFSEEAFYEALGEEMKASADFFDDRSSCKCKTYDLSPAEAVKELRNVEKGTNWVLMGLKK